MESWSDGKITTLHHSTTPTLRLTYFRTTQMFR